MYLAPLNYDRFFKKVFSDLEIAQAFLEDVFDAQIESLELLPAKHKVTDSAIGVEFDFRCKMDGKPVIIDMQQWYKMDVVRRFYTYHTLSTALQLESLPVKSISAGGKESKKKIRDYSGVEPVVTLVWMVDDALGTSEDFLSYALFPQQAASFALDAELWQNPKLARLVLEREKVVALLKNSTKSLDFLSKNRLIFAFQPNIVKNKKHSKYFRWFDFAEKTRNKENSKDDFRKYQKDKIMARIMQRTNTDVLDESDMEYITDFEQYRLELMLLESGIRKEGVEEGMQKGIAIGEQKGIAIGKQEGIAIGEAKAKEKAKTELRKKIRLANLQTARLLLQNNTPAELVMEITQLTRKEVENLQVQPAKLNGTGRKPSGAPKKPRR